MRNISSSSRDCLPAWPFVKTILFEQFRCIECAQGNHSVKVLWPKRQWLPRSRNVIMQLYFRLSTTTICASWKMIHIKFIVIIIVNNDDHGRSIRKDHRLRTNTRDDHSANNMIWIECKTYERSFCMLSCWVLTINHYSLLLHQLHNKWAMRYPFH